MKYENIPVSVCIPTYNRSYCIKETLLSILNSTHKNIHIFVGDNCSSDNTEEVVRSINDDRIRYVKFKEYVDVNYSFIRCLKLADTEIVCLYHSDDWYYPDIIENELKYIVQDDIGAVFTLIKNCLLSESRNIYSYNANSPLFIYDYKKYINEALVRGTIFNCPTFMTKRSVLEDVGLFNKKTGMISDLNFWLLILRKYKATVINQYYQNYIYSNSQLSTQIFKNRAVLSPQFIVMDNELEECDNSIIEPKNLKIYNYRKKKELLSMIIENAKINNVKEVIRYANLLTKMEKLTIQNISGCETSYLQKLYHKI